MAFKGDWTVERLIVGGVSSSAMENMMGGMIGSIIWLIENLWRWDDWVDSTREGYIGYCKSFETM